MKKGYVLGILILGLLFAGCSEKKPLLPEEGKAQPSSETTPYPTLAPDWSNWTDRAVSSSYGGAVNLWEKEDTVFGEWTVITGDTVEAKLVYRWDLDKYKEYGEAKTVTIVTVNDNVCEFELNGQPSENGVLSANKVMNQETVEQLLITDCTLKEGENKLGIHTAVYFPQIGHVMTSSLIRTFQAENGREQTVTELCGTEEDLEFSITTSEGMDEREIKAELTKGSDYYFKQLSHDSSKRCTTIPWDGEFGIEFRNTGGASGVTPVEREVLILVLKNGELIPMQGDERVYLCSLSDEELCRKIPLELNGGAGEYAHVAFVYFDLSRDGSTFWNERLFYFQ